MVTVCEFSPALSDDLPKLNNFYGLFRLFYVAVLLKELSF